MLGVGLESMGLGWGCGPVGGSEPPESFKQEIRVLDLISGQSIECIQGSRRNILMS